MQKQPLTKELDDSYANIGRRKPVQRYPFVISGKVVCWFGPKIILEYGLFF